MNTNIDDILKHLWNEIRVNTPGEPNLHDVKLMAQTLKLHYVDELPTDPPKNEIGLKIVEYIDSNLFKSPSSYQINHVVRNLTFDDFSNRLREIAKKSPAGRIFTWRSY